MLVRYGLHLVAQFVGIKASHELLDHNLDPAFLETVRKAANRVPGVSVAAVTGREHGSDKLVELSIRVNPQMTIDRASALAEDVRQAVYAEVPDVGDVVVELNTNHIARLHRKLR